MKKASFIMLSIAYLPLMFYDKGVIGGIFNDFYAVLSAAGTGLLLMYIALTDKDYLAVTVSVIMFSLSAFFFLNMLYPKAYLVYKIEVLTILFLEICFVVLILLLKRPL